MKKRRQRAGAGGDLIAFGVPPSGWHCPTGADARLKAVLPTITAARRYYL